MKSFPKKYNPQELHDRAKQYRTNINKDNNNYVFSLWDIPISQKLSYQDFFYHYTRDFLDYLNNRNHWESKYQQLFITSNDQLKNICSGYDFFNQKKQTLSQVWINKFERRMISTSKKIWMLILKFWITIYHLHTKYMFQILNYIYTY